MPAWRAFYRIQVNADFDLSGIGDLAGYLHELGISHVYLSPILQATAGSTHGYDVVDPAQINTDWGGERAYEASTQKLAELGLGQVLDIVPNHMALATPANHWWWDVLKRGQDSPFYRFFDLGWHGHLPDPFISLPILGGALEKLIEDHKLEVTRRNDELALRYEDWLFPLSTGSVLWLISDIAPRSVLLAPIVDSLNEPHLTTERREALLRQALGTQQVAEELDQQLTLLDAAKLTALLERQHYRLVDWHGANTTWYYRRFFDVSTLIGLNIEDPHVLSKRHEKEFALLSGGALQGFRVDHIDGLRDPQAYLDTVRNKFPDAGLWVEKILEHDETLPSSWPVQGTTGYEYLNMLNGVFIDQAGERELTQVYEGFCGDDRSYADVLETSKRQVLDELFGGELDYLSRMLTTAAEAELPEPFSLDDLKACLVEYIVALPVYRTYGWPSAEASSFDARTILQTVLAARASRPDLDPRLFDFLHSLLSGHLGSAAAREFASRLQQLTGPVMAKGAEDTSFYRYSRLLSLNEVGGNPASFGCSVADWHAFCTRMSDEWPLTLVATTTHDTKRSEDTRQRLNVLASVPGEWAEVVQEFQAAIGRLSHLPAPGSTTLFILLQTLIAGWPLSAERLHAYMSKAAREAKLETSWVAPDAEYEQNLHAYIDRLLADGALSQVLENFVRLIDSAARRNSLAQVVLKLTAPGIPDTYRGTEVFSYTLVDPDNRQPVDYAHLRAVLNRVSGADYDPSWESQDPDAAKMWLLRQALQFRADHAGAFEQRSSYTPLAAEGPDGGRAICYLRGDSIAVIAVRWTVTEASIAATVELPPGTWRNHFTQKTMAGRVSLTEVLGDLPAAILERMND